MAITVGELLVSLRASTAAFAKDLDKASQLSLNSSKEIQRSWTRLSGAIAAEMAVAAAAIGALVTRSIDLADKTGKLAQSTGLSVEQFSGLAFAANLSDVSTETLSRSLVILAKNLEKSNQQTLEGKAAHSALATLFRGNIPVFKDTGEAFIAIATQLAKLPDGFEKTALTAQIMGSKTGAALIPMFKGLQSVVNEAKELGIVISGKTAADAERFNDTIKRLETVVQALGLRLAEQLLPYLQQLANLLLENSKNAATSQTNINSLANGVRALAVVVIAAVGALRELGLIATVLAIQLRPFVDFTDTASKNSADTKDAVRLLNEQFKGTIETLQALLDPMKQVSVATTAVTTADAGAARALAEAEARRLKAVENAKKLAEAVKSATDEVQHSIAVLTLGADATKLLELANMGASKAAIENLKALQDFNRELAAGLINSDGTRKALELISVTSGETVDKWINLKLAGIDLFEATRTPLERLGKAMAENNELYKAGVIDADTLTRAQHQLGVQFGLIAETVVKINPALRAMGDAIAETFIAGVFHADSFVDALGRILEQLAEVIFQALVLKPLFDWLAGGGGIFKSIFGGFLAGGGQTSPGEAYVVGENGPEMFYPGVTGTVVSNTNSRGGNTYNIDARGTDPVEVERRVRRAIAESEARSVGRALVAQREMAWRTP